MDNHDNHDNHDGCDWYFGVPFKSKRKEAEMAAPQRKFKVGDRVRFTEAVTREDWWFKAGQAGTVSWVGSDSYYYHVDVDGDDTAFVDDEHIRHILPRGTRIQLLRDHGVYKAGHRGTVTYENDENVGALMDIGRYAAFPHEVVGVTDDNAPDCAGRKGERDHKFSPGDVVRGKFTQSLYKIARIKTHYRDGRPYFGKPAYDYTDDNGWDREEDVELVTSSSSCIVALINKDGKPRPSQWPHVHPDSASATAEAERLARNNPGTEFAVYQRVAGRVASVEMKEVA